MPPHPPLFAIAHNADIIRSGLQQALFPKCHYLLQQLARIVRSAKHALAA